MVRSVHFRFIVSLGLLGLVSCSPAESDSVDEIVELPDTIETPDRYQFPNGDGVETASYRGQIARHALIAALSEWMFGLSARIDDGSYSPGSVEQVEADIRFFYDCADGLCGEYPIGDSATVQQVLDDIASGKDLVGKTAGNDALTDHKDWTSGGFKGWKGADSPEALLQEWFSIYADQAYGRVGGELLQGPTGATVPVVHVTPDGLDLVQLTQKFLLGAVAFSQGTDDYLDDDIEGKGLLATHASWEEGEAYTPLEHAWDEAFGYFGASAHYPRLSDQEIAEGVTLDVDEDGLTDLCSERNWGHSVNAAKRDLGASDGSDFTLEAWRGFAEGRQLLAETAGSELSAEEFSRLVAHRDQAVLAWEEAIAATVVHYINETLKHMGTFGSDSYEFTVHAKHWSEMKGFALGLQFNPRSPLSDSEFVEFHEYLLDAPVLPSASTVEVEAYREALRTARQLIADSYGFDPVNVGDAEGQNGW